MVNDTAVLQKIKLSGILSEQEQEALDRLICYDELTGLKNRRSFNIDSDIELRRAERIGYDVTLLMIDIDHFKEYNDTKGHVAGDRALKRVSEAMRTAIRGIDSIYRYGGEEYAILLPNTTIEGGYLVAERVREAVQTQTDVTISVGLSNYKGTATDLESFVQQSDKALYLSKERGRNQTTIYETR